MDSWFFVVGWGSWGRRGEGLGMGGLPFVAKQEPEEEGRAEEGGDDPNGEFGRSDDHAGGEISEHEQDGSAEERGEH